MISKNDLRNWFCKDTQCAATSWQLEESEDVPISRQHLHPVSTDRQSDMFASCDRTHNTKCSHSGTFRDIRTRYFLGISRLLNRPPKYFIPTRYRASVAKMWVAVFFRSPTSPLSLSSQTCERSRRRRARLDVVLAETGIDPTQSGRRRNANRRVLAHEISWVYFAKWPRRQAQLFGHFNVLKNWLEKWLCCIFV